MMPLAAFTQSVHYKFTTTTEPSSATLAEILITDSSGTPVKASFRLCLRDTVNHQLRYVYSYTFDERAGRPYAQYVLPGMYDIGLEADRMPFWFHVPIVGGMKNAIVLEVPAPGLSFRYDGATEKPVVGYEATIVREDNPLVAYKQACHEERHYMAGKYKVEVNTLPVSRFKVYMDWGTVNNVLKIPEPGMVQVMNTESIGKADLYYMLAGKLVKLREVAIMGDTTAQQLQLLPGAYEIHWWSAIGKSDREQQATGFVVKSNETTRLMLQ
jgi:hypothetical protein